MLTLDAKIEGLLFFTAEPLSYKEIANMLGASVPEVKEAVVVLREKNQARGVVVCEREDTVTLGTSPELSTLLEKIRKEELDKELTRATLETLSIILYKNGATRSEIDYIRGVNSSFILRNLSIRGLVEKAVHPTDSRKIVYKPTIEAQNYMGVASISDIPEFAQYHALLNQSLEGAVAKEVAEEGSITEE